MCLGMGHFSEITPAVTVKWEKEVPDEVKEAFIRLAEKLRIGKELDDRDDNDLAIMKANNLLEQSYAIFKGELSSISLSMFTQPLKNVEKLLKAGVCVDSKNLNGFTMLQSVIDDPCFRNHFGSKRIEIFLRYGANPNVFHNEKTLLDIFFERFEEINRRCQI